MGELRRYTEAVREIILEYAGYKPSHGEIKTEAVMDEERGHYEVVHVEWDGTRRVWPPYVRQHTGFAVD